MKYHSKNAIKCNNIKWGLEPVQPPLEVDYCLTLSSHLAMYMFYITRNHSKFIVDLNLFLQAQEYVAIAAHSCTNLYFHVHHINSWYAIYHLGE